MSKILPGDGNLLPKPDPNEADKVLNESRRAPWYELEALADGPHKQHEPEEVLKTHEEQFSHGRGLQVTQHINERRKARLDHQESMLPQTSFLKTCRREPEDGKEDVNPLDQLDIDVGDILDAVLEGPQIMLLHIKLADIKILNQRIEDKIWNPEFGDRFIFEDKDYVYLKPFDGHYYSNAIAIVAVDKDGKLHYFNIKE